MNKKLLMLVLLCFFVFISCSSEKKRWENAESENNIAAYEVYLKQYPEGKYADNANARIEELIWQSTLEDNSINGHEAYLKQYPEGKYADSAKVKLKEMYYRAAESENTISAYEEFLKKHSDSEFADDARSRLNILKKELSKWEQAQRVDTIRAYWQFIVKNPQSQYVENANAKISEYEANKRRRDTLDKSKKEKIRAEKVEPLIAALRGNSNTTARDEEAKVDPLTAARRKISNNTIRYEAAKELGDIGDKRAVEPLIVALRDEYDRVQKEAAIALGKLGDKRAVMPLIVAMDLEEELKRGKDKRWFFLRYAARSLGQIGDNRAVEALIVLLKMDKNGESFISNEKHIDSVAAIALGNIGDERAVEPLIASLKDDRQHRWECRCDAAEALGKIKNPKSVESLIFTALENTYYKVRDKSRTLLLQMEDPRAVEVYIDIVKNSDSSEMRIKAAKILKDSKDPRAVKVQALVLNIIEEETYITELTLYDGYDRPAVRVLKNIDGKEVAKKQRMYNEYNGLQIDSEITFDLITGKIIHATEYEFGKPKNPMWLCLDKKGNIIKKSGKPVLVKLFDAKQRYEHENVYNGAFIRGGISNYFPCNNCAEKTGIKNCRYVW